MDVWLDGTSWKIESRSVLNSMANMVIGQEGNIDALTSPKVHVHYILKVVIENIIIILSRENEQKAKKSDSSKEAGESMEIWNQKEN
jgi:hypothetical protein